MGRHGGGDDAPPPRRPTVLVLALVVLVLGAIGLGVWWWHLRSGSDPVGDHPVAGIGVVVTSPACGGAGDTVVAIGATGGPRTTIGGCGFAAGQKISIEYRSGRTDLARLAGTSTAGADSVPAWVPLAILAAGLSAVGATLVLLFDRRFGRRGAGPAMAGPATAGAATRGRSVSELRQGMGLTDRPITRHAAAEPD